MMLISQTKSMVFRQRFSQPMALQLPHLFRPHKVVICSFTNNVTILFLQCSYKKKLPPGKLQDVKRETGYVLSDPGDFLFLDKFIFTGFINKIYNMEVVLVESMLSCTKASKYN